MPKNGFSNKVCVLSAEEIEDWYSQNIEPRCSDHDHITAREANLEVYPWQTVNQTECHQLSRVVGQNKGRICIQRLRAYTWAIRYSRTEIARGIPGKKGTYGPGIPAQVLVQCAAQVGGKWNRPSNGFPEKMVAQRKAEQKFIEDLNRFGELRDLNAAGNRPTSTP